PPRLTPSPGTGYLLRAEGFIASSRCSDELKGKSGASCPAGQFRRCPAAVIGNEPRHRTGPPAGKRRTVGTRPSPPVHEPEDLPRPEDASVFRLTWSLRGEVAGGIAWPWPRSVPAPVPLAAPARPRGRRSPWRRARCPAAHVSGPRAPPGRGDRPPPHLRDTGRGLRARHWRLQREAGIDLPPSNDFSLYDQVLDTALLFDAIPRRYRAVVEAAPLAGYFA